MVGKKIAFKKYVVRLSAEERAQLDELIRKGRRSAQLLTKARILLKADVSELGVGWSDSRIPDTAKIVLVQDNLNTHKPASLYEAFPAVEARRLVERFEWHYTPKHGSWLDMAESELGVLASQCLDRRIADKQILAHEVNAWQDHRNKHHAKANWQFKTADARVKLKRLYPQFG